MIKKKIIRAVVIVVILLITALAFLFSFRSSILGYAIEKYQKKFRDSYHTTLSIKAAAFIDLNSVRLSGLTIVPDQRDTLIIVHSVEASISLFKAVFGIVKLNRLDVQD